MVLQNWNKKGLTFSQDTGKGLRFQALFGEKPLSTKVYATYGGSTSAPNICAYFTETYENGMARVKTTLPGTWFIRVQHKLTESPKTMTSTCFGLSWYSALTDVFKTLITGWRWLFAEVVLGFYSFAFGLSFRLRKFWPCICADIFQPHNAQLPEQKCIL